VGHLLSQTRITVKRELAATHRVGINRQELQQVIINLLINAIQAMPEGGELRLQTQDTPQGAELRVLDTGTGLSDQALARLFRPFFTTKNDGNGLGLWISQGLLERYGAHIAAGNRSDGTGAVFTVTLLTEAQAPVAVGTGDGRPGVG